MCRIECLAGLQEVLSFLLEACAQVLYVYAVYVAIPLLYGMVCCHTSRLSRDKAGRHHAQAAKRLLVR